MKNNEKNRSAFQVMLGLIGMIYPLLGIGSLYGYFSGVRLGVLFTCMILFAVLRGILRYAEQAANHYSEKERKHSKNLHRQYHIAWRDCDVVSRRIPLSGRNAQPGC